MAEIKWIVSTRSGNPVTVLDTGLNALASSAAAISSAIDNDADLDTYADFQLSVTFGSAPTDASICSLYLVRTVDGTNFEDASTTGPVVPRGGFVGAFSVRAVTSAQVMILKEVLLPPRDFKVMLVNSTNQAFPASGSTVKMLTYKQQVV